VELINFISNLAPIQYRRQIVRLWVFQEKNIKELFAEQAGK